MNTTQETKPSFDDVINELKSDWCMEAICQTGDVFEAFIRTKHSNYSLGSFKDKSEAEQAIRDAIEARFNG